MSTLLHLDASAQRDTSISRALSAEFVQAWCEAYPGGTVVRRDLAAAEIPLIDEEWIIAAFASAEKRSEAQKDLLRLSDSLVSELKQCDEIVIGTPMYNFAPPAALKLWIDQVVRLGETYAYVDGKRQGCLPNKRVYVLIAAGGHYEAGSKAADSDHVSSYLQAVLGYMGIEKVAIHWAGGTQALLKPDSDRAGFLAFHRQEVREMVKAS